MGWKLDSITVSDDQTIASAIDEQFEGLEKGHREEMDEYRDQINAAAKAAESLRKAVARPDDSVNVQLSGNSNEDHEVGTRSTDPDSVTIVITQVPAPEEA